MKKWLSFLMCGLLCGGLLSGCSQGKTYTNSIGMEFVKIPAGTFMMGSVASYSKTSHADESPAHQVTISKPFYMGKFEVTQEQWSAVMGDTPSHLHGVGHPVESVTWEDAQVFIQKLNEKEGGNKYRLPTEAEWEYAARAGTKTLYFWGNNPAVLDQYAWFGENSERGTHSVGEKKPNPWGLYDIYGNVFEWVEDWYYYGYKAGAVIDPTGPDEGSLRVFRGGSWSSTAGICRSAYRYCNAPASRYFNLGFRLAFSTVQ
jgi:formylglycine-generating enzyme required for sulfatase activity